MSCFGRRSTPISDSYSCLANILYTLNFCHRTTNFNILQRGFNLVDQCIFSSWYRESVGWSFPAVDGRLRCPQMEKKKGKVRKKRIYSNQFLFIFIKIVAIMWLSRIMQPISRCWELDVENSSWILWFERTEYICMPHFLRKKTWKDRILFLPLDYRTSFLFVCYCKSPKHALNFVLVMCFGFHRVNWVIPVFRSLWVKGENRPLCALLFANAQLHVAGFLKSPGPHKDAKQYDIRVAYVVQATWTSDVCFMAWLAWPWWRKTGCTFDKKKKITSAFWFFCLLR